MLAKEVSSGLSVRIRLAAGYWLFFSTRRRHTRCSRDWSSAVCSSDLTPTTTTTTTTPTTTTTTTTTLTTTTTTTRSEERRGGKECRCRWSTDHQKKKKKNNKPINAHAMYRQRSMNQPLISSTTNSINHRPTEYVSTVCTTLIYS